MVLDERGDMPTSTELALRMEKAMNQSQADWTLLIGGANGHAPGMRNQADWVWSLSRLTLPHDLALLGRALEDAAHKGERLLVGVERLI